MKQKSVDGDGRYFRQMLDKDARFIVTHMLSNGRTAENATEVLRQALKTPDSTIHRRFIRI